MRMGWWFNIGNHTAPCKLPFPNSPEWVEWLVNIFLRRGFSCHRGVRSHNLLALKTSTP
jgi:hypothetical protein